MLLFSLLPVVSSFLANFSYKARAAIVPKWMLRSAPFNPSVAVLFEKKAQYDSLLIAFYLP